MLQEMLWRDCSAQIAGDQLLIVLSYLVRVRVRYIIFRVTIFIGRPIHS